MRLPARASSVHAHPGRRGSALLLSFLALIVLAAIIFQLFIGTSTDARVARNELTLVAMDQAIESALLEVFNRLKEDGEADAQAGNAASPGAGAADAGIPGGDGAADAGAGEEQAEPSAPSDSREDSWGKPQRTTINDIELRILVQDEDSKLNVLGILAEDRELADRWVDRVARVIDLAREGTEADIDAGMARRMVETMRDHLTNRSASILPRPALSSDDDDNRSQGLPLSLRELVVLDPFDPSLFRDFRDENGEVVHSLGSFLTVWTSVEAAAIQGAGDPGTGGAGAGGAGAPADASTPSGAGAPASGSIPSQTQGQAPGQGQSGAGQGGTGQGTGGQGAGAGASTTPASSAGTTRGVAVNVNTAPAAVLKALVDEREVSSRFWDEVIEFRNLEQKQETEDPDAEPVYDEFGEEIIERQVFDTLKELGDVPGWERLNGEQRALLGQLLTTQSQIFSVYVSARKATGQGSEFGGELGRKLSLEEEEAERANQIVRTVRAVVWRYSSGDSVRIVSLVRWELIDYTPLEVLDYPGEDR